MAVAQIIMQDVVVLKSGSVYRGLITERNGDQLKLETECGNLISIPLNEIDSTFISKSKDIRTYPYHQKESGYFNVTSLGVPIGTQQQDYYYYNQQRVVAGFTAQTIHGYRFHSNFLAGGGCGIEVVQDPMLHLFADARYEILKLQYTPYLVADAGYGLNLRADINTAWQSTAFSGGGVWGIGAGMRFNFNQAGAVVFDAQYKISHRSEEVSYPESDSYVNKYTMRRIVFKIGLAF